jgi:integrase
LSESSFDLRAEPPTVTVQAAFSKRKRLDVQPLPQQLVPKLEAWLAEDSAIIQLHGSKTPLWPRRWAANGYGSKMVQHDLKAADIPYEDEDGRVFDFHALRSQYVTGLDRAGVSLQQAQKLARHSDPRLTANLYTRREMGELADAVNMLPGISKTGS